MNASLKGTFTCSMVSKGRMAFPQKLRNKLGSDFVVTIGQGCLNVYSNEEWDSYLEKLRTLTGAKANAARRIVGDAADVSPDGQGRINITPELCDYAGLSKDITIVGVINHAEIWDSARYKAFIDSVSEDDLNEVMAEFAF
jgi:MraZ protein